MAFTALQLITKSYYLSQIVARDLQTVSGSQINDGLDLLNDLLDIKSSDLRLIPYWRRYEFDTVASQGEYFIENLLAVDAMTFNLGDVRFPMTDMSRRQFFATARVDNIDSLPFSYRIERELNGSRIYLYFEPSQVYRVKLSGKFSIPQVTLYQDLSLTLDRYYIEYLRFALAEYICLDYGNTFPDGAAAKFAEIRKKLMDISPADLALKKYGVLGQRNFGMDWQWINLGVGYVP